MTPEHEKKFGRNAMTHLAFRILSKLCMFFSIPLIIATIVLGILKGNYEELVAPFNIILILTIVFASLFILFFILRMIFAVKTHNQAFVVTEEDKKYEPNYTHHI